PGEVDSVPWVKQNDGRSLRLEQFLFRRRDIAVLASHGKRWHHQSEWFLLAMLALTQTSYGARLASIDQKLESANAFQREDISSQESCSAVGNGPVKFRSADRTRVRLRMKTAIRGILIFIAARRAQDEFAHR